MSDDPNGERLYNPDGWGCGSLFAPFLLLVLAVPGFIAAAALT